ncbi:hypothetical protein BU15DRAFT_86539 [Melanogaster broomeanus]|nr:hypothetical protein BU15DRAFT_86539 [Melanogaster broomeanus]
MFTTDHFLKSLAEDSALWFTVALKETMENSWGTVTSGYNIPKNRDGEFSISLFPKFWNKGYGMEAAKFTRVSLTVLEGNAAAKALYSKMKEGRKRRGNWAEGHWEDIIYMGILQEEWVAQQNRIPA